MAARIISGNEVAAEILAELRDRVQALARNGVVPGLATVLVGDDPASHVYVGMKNKDAQALGLYSRQITLPADTPQEELLGLVTGEAAPARAEDVFFRLAGECAPFRGLTYGSLGVQGQPAATT